MTGLFWVLIEVAAFVIVALVALAVWALADGKPRFDRMMDQAARRGR
jgi:hypothetical protein